MHLPDQAGRVGDASLVEREVSHAGLPGIVEQDPADRDPRRPEPGDVLEHVLGPVGDVAPLDQLQLGARRHPRPPRLCLVGAKRLRERARVQVLVEPRALDTHLGAVASGGKPHTGPSPNRQPVPPADPGNASAATLRVPRRTPQPAELAKNGTGRIRARLGNFDLEDLAAQVDVLAALATAEKVLAGAGFEGVVDLLDVRFRMQA